MSSDIISLVLGLAALVFAVWILLAIFGRIASRAGYSHWWALIILVPMLNVLMLWIFAFAIWPVMKPRGQA